jgi:hypothetical protein
MTKYCLILGVSVILMLSTRGAMAMDTFLGLFAEAKENFSIVVAGSSNASKYVDEKNTHKERGASKSKGVISVHQETSVTSESDYNETSQRVRYSKMSILLPWTFAAKHKEMDFIINRESQPVRAFESNGEFKIHYYNNAQFISLPIVNGQILIRHNPTSVQPITSDDIEVFQQCTTMQPVKTLLVPFVDLTKVGEGFKITDEGITMVVTKTNHMSTFIREGDSKPHCRTEGVTLSINSPFSFAFLKNVNNVDCQILCGEVDSFTILELYKGG